MSLRCRPEEVHQWAGIDTPPNAMWVKLAKDWLALREALEKLLAKPEVIEDGSGWCAGCGSAAEIDPKYHAPSCVIGCASQLLGQHHDS